MICIYRCRERQRARPVISTGTTAHRVWELPPLPTPHSLSPRALILPILWESGRHDAVLSTWQTHLTQGSSSQDSLILQVFSEDTMYMTLKYVVLVVTFLFLLF